MHFYKNKVVSLHQAKNNMTPTKIHEIDVLIDVFTPCLKDILTGEVVNTEVIRIRRKSFQQVQPQKRVVCQLGKDCGGI